MTGQIRYTANASQSYTFASHSSKRTVQSLQKSMPAQAHRQSITSDRQITTEKRAACNSIYPKGGVPCSKDSLVFNGSLVFKIKFCGKSHALRVASKPLAESSKTNEYFWSH